tara:strand:+ start:90 stop:779 length:690 start_codon:yes stop_codon:yes gene_type:complete
MIKVTYIDHMGSDLSVVNAARVSFGKNSKPLNHESLGDDPTMIPFLPETDTKLINYLARHHHKSPFNHAFATFHVKAPIFVARQLQKHEYMPWNEISRRYVDDKPDWYWPKDDVWRGRAKDKKQGSEGFIDLKEDLELLDDVVETTEWCRALYSKLLDKGIAPEQARMVLPQSTMTEWYWSGSLYAFSKMCGLRLKPDTQYETRLVAEQIGDKMIELFPESWIALRAYA